MDSILKKQAALTAHPVYQTLNTLEGIRHFMGYHVYAVWDFMSLLKSLQRKITCVDLPWRPSPYPAEMVRLINQIVLGEESDLDQNGNPISHFELYLRSMTEIGASTAGIRDFMATLDVASIPQGARAFVRHNLDTAMHGSVLEVASSFFFGREKLIPEMFTSMVEVLKREKMEAPTFLYYLERHIEVDAGEHGPLAMKCLETLVGNDLSLKFKAEWAGLKALDARQALWDSVLANS